MQFLCGRTSNDILHALLCPQGLFSFFQTTEIWLDFQYCKLLVQGVPGSNSGSDKHFFLHFHDFLFQKLLLSVKRAVLLLNLRYFGALIFQEIKFFEHLKYNFETSWPPKIWIFKKHFTAKITPILMIKKIPQTFLDVEN